MSIETPATSDPEHIDEATFTPEQWDAIASYRQARKTQRRLSISVLCIIGTVVLSSILLHVLVAPAGSLFTISSWIHYGIPAVGVIVGLLAGVLSRVVVMHARASMRESGVTDEWITAFDQYPSRKM
ncbi:hypothetical protein B0G84_8331 [Paraburkholderia sp. BL8N3]|nr:hypothetical protein [Paraburkholderia sp. BL8N3]TCK32523.1 hypothetical protein B0G84_8331 [Paraburkholderia sp. BL8N3]